MTLTTTIGNKKKLTFDKPFLAFLKRNGCNKTMDVLVVINEAQHMRSSGKVRNNSNESLYLTKPLPFFVKNYYDGSEVTVTITEEGENYVVIDIIYCYDPRW